MASSLITASTESTDQPSAVASKKSTSSECNERKRGWDEIEDLFAEKKKGKLQAAASEKAAVVIMAASKKASKKAKKSIHTSKPDDGWVDDHLGGRYNTEGYTGRVESGMKIFKAHVLAKPNAGQTDACPFDCDCCYI